MGLLDQERKLGEVCYALTRRLSPQTAKQEARGFCGGWAGKQFLPQLPPGELRGRGGEREDSFLGGSLAQEEGGGEYDECRLSPRLWLPAL